MRDDPVFRRPKRGAAADCWHTLRVGLAVFIVLLIVLPPLLD